MQLTWKMRLQDFTVLLVLHKNGLDFLLHQYTDKQLCLLTGNIRFNKLTPLQWIVFFGGKAFFIFHRIIVPLLVGMSIGQLVLLIQNLFAIYYKQQLKFYLGTSSYVL